MKYLMGSEGKTRKDEDKELIFKEEIGIQNMLRELEEKQLQWVHHVRGMDRKRTLKGLQNQHLKVKDL
jgi:hypothetical protein